MGESNKFVYDTKHAPLTTHMWYDGTQHPWEFKRVWHVEPSLTDPDTVYAGVEDAALFRSTDGGQSWHELPGLRGHGTGPQWQPGAGGMGLHTILLDETNPQRIYIVGNGYGWSTLELSIINLNSRVVCVEPECAIDVTNAIAEAEGMNCKVVHGLSPGDNADIIGNYFSGVPDFVLIDALHDPQSIQTDFRSIAEICGDNCIYVFHDILTFSLVEAVQAIVSGRPDLALWILPLTTSGMAIISPQSLAPNARAFIEAFTATPSAIAALRRLAFERNMAPQDSLAGLL
jgi:hypothetical protein